MKKGFYMGSAGAPIIFISVFAFVAILAALFVAFAKISPVRPSILPVDAEEELLFESGKFRYVRSKNLKAPNAPQEAILFLHGFNNQLAVWNDVVANLGPCQDTLRIDLPGFGGSTWSSDDFTLPIQAKRIISLLDHLKLRKVTLVGVSMGGSVSAWIAAHYPERVQALVLIAASGYPGSLQYGGVYGRLLKPGLANRLAMVLSGSWLYRQLFPSSVAFQGLSVTSSYGEPWAQALPRIQAPTTLLWSKGDLAVPVEFAYQIQKQIPNSELILSTDEAGHDIPGRQPEWVGERVCKIHQEFRKGKP